MSRRIVVASQKGGVGKTTVCLNLGVALAERGRSVVVADLDPQGGIGLALARGETEWPGLVEHLAGQIQVSEALLQTKLPGLRLLPRGRLNPVDAPAFEAACTDRDVLEGVLGTAGDGSDLVIIDTPSGLGRITRSALAVADFVLIPFQAEPLALRSASQMLALVDHVRSDQNPNLALLGLCPTMVELAKGASLDVMRELWAGFSGVLDTAIPRSDEITTASAEGLPLSHLGGPLRPEARRFALLAAEIEGRIAELDGKEGSDDVRPRRELV